MKNGCHYSRRRFIKSTAAGTAGIGLAGISAPAAAKTGGWQNGMQINPDIDNLRVVCCHDPDMVTLDCNDISNFNQMVNQNTYVDRDTIHANLDEMAKELAQEQTPSTAWAKIFRKPANKSWDEVVIAMKVNCIAENHPRLAVVEKICLVLGPSGLGARYSNMIVYDGKHNAAGLYTPFAGLDNLPQGYTGAYLPDGVVVSNYSSLLGGTHDAPTPSPDEGNYECTKHIADGRVDILVNFAVNKGHGDSRGGCTLTMKNHFGTFTPQPHGHGDLDYLLAINKSDAVVGGNPSRQQLCIIDSLWSANGGPSGAPNKNTHRLIMGTFGPAVDYATVYNLRKPIMNDTVTAQAEAALERFALDFGYNVQDFNGIAFSDVTPASQVRQNTSRFPAAGLRQLHFSLTGRFKGKVTFSVSGKTPVTRIDILDIRGRIIQTLPVSPDSSVVHWDGLNRYGSDVASGRYIIVIGGNEERYQYRVLNLAVR
ncbi:MAG: DUF362 domain-containing protein [Chitinivibrionales bacterium]|nr:DUF362 domain-containing protein [Chitinivibrionales bacterium]